MPIRTPYQGVPARRRACMLPVFLALAATSSAQEDPTSPGDPRSRRRLAHDARSLPGPVPGSRTVRCRARRHAPEATGQLRAINPSAVNGSATSTAAGLRAGAAPSSTTASNTTAESAADKPLRELLQERLRLFDEYDKATTSFKKAAHPEPNPEQQANDARGDLLRLQALWHRRRCIPRSCCRRRSPSRGRVPVPGRRSAPGDEGGPGGGDRRSEGVEGEAGVLADGGGDWEGLQCAPCRARQAVPGGGGDEGPGGRPGGANGAGSASFHSGSGAAACPRATGQCRMEVAGGGHAAPGRRGPDCAGGQAGGRWRSWPCRSHSCRSMSPRRSSS